jgi:hydrolase, TatD family
VLVDSHCHLDRVDLSPYEGSFARFMESTLASGVGHMLCVAIDLESHPAMVELVAPWEAVSVSVGVHPNDRDREEPDVERLVALARHPRNVAIGETGLDYFRSEGELGWQQERFRTHIRAAIAAGKPLVIHTREAREDTLRIMEEEKARDAGGVMHCFTENWEMARRALDMGFYISFSGIVTFRNADELREVVKKMPMDRLLIETDAPYLAPVPHRGKPNEPRHVRLVAEKVAEVRGMDPEEVIGRTGENFFSLFASARRPQE